MIPLLSHLLEHVDSVTDISLKPCSNLIGAKLKNYNSRFKNNNSYFVVICDPRLNIKYLKNNLNKTDFENIETLFREEFNKYVIKYSKTPEPTQLSEVSTSSLLHSIYKT